MEDLVLQFGYAGLFVVSFLAATLAPLGSEAAVCAMVISRADPGWVFLAATSGNVLGALVNYGIGKWGARFVFSRWTGPDEKSRQKARETYGRWGSPVLFFAWVPVLGDPLTVAAGVLNVNVFVFLFWVTLGKALRYWAVIQGVELFL